MFTIRDSQLHALGLEAHRHFLRELAAHMRTHFPARVSSLDHDALKACLSATLATATEFGLRDAPDQRRFLNLAGTYGWDFLEAPANAWMRRALTDSNVSAPGERLRLLVGQCLHRMDVKRKNDAQREAARVAADSDEGPL